MWLFVNNQHWFGYIQITTLNNKNTFGTHNQNARTILVILEIRIIVHLMPLALFQSETD